MCVSCDMDALKKKKISFEEYLEIERNEGVKYEFHGGEIFAMAGGTNRHSRICKNICREIDNALIKKSGDCDAFSSETKLFIPSLNKTFYPDAMVICKPFNEEEIEHYMTNPTVIVEVISDGTEAYDRGDKFSYYRKISTLKEYILISQKTAKVEVSKKVSDLWLTRYSSGLDEELKIESLDVEIDLSEIYRGVDFLPKV